MKHFYLKATAASVATLILAATSVFAQHSNHAKAIDCIPAKSMGYLYADLQGMNKFQGLEFFKSLYQEIQLEVDELAVEQIGLPASQFKEVAVIFPPLEESTLKNMPADPTKTFLGIMTFVDAIDPADAVATLDGEWNIFNANGRKVFACKERGLCVYHFADNAVVFGSDTWVTWYMQQRAEPASKQGLSNTFALAASGQIGGGINAKSIPQSIRDEVGEGLEALDWAGFSLNLSDGVRVKLASQFDAEADATTAIKQLENLNKLAKFQMKSEESMALREFRNRDSGHPEIAFMSLSRLASARYGIRTLKGMDITKNGSRVDVELYAKNFDLAAVSIISLTAIQAIGNKANAEFEAIAAELSAK